MFRGWLKLFFLTNFGEVDFYKALFIATETKINNYNKKQLNQIPNKI